ncbi:Hypothetical_protein [Hexamita inflata]|uniref:Hypothetical_protein n=1 Tax=Hexamita inflata TaxID=28002 RepID=A0AA86N964_9EUKA|nr:Hypothetical protein HINF_LOCUS2344 [Hexamita inflata]
MNNQIEQLLENLTEYDKEYAEAYVNRPIFQAYLQKRPDFNPNMLDEYFGTIAMFKLEYNLEIEESIRHDPNIQNNEGKTIEMLCHIKNIEPQRWMLCEHFIKDNTCNSVIRYRNKTVRPLTKKLRKIDEYQNDFAESYVNNIYLKQGLTFIEFQMRLHDCYRDVLRVYDNIPNYQPYEYIL